MMMKPSVKGLGILGAAAAACVACCVGAAFMLPMLGWLGLTGIGAIATGWYLPMAGVFVVALVAFVVRRRVHAENKVSTQNGCGCNSAESTFPEEGKNMDANKSAPIACTSGGIR
jgi:membrane protein implicated in regulation of membrane protease activity